MVGNIVGEAWTSKTTVRWWKQGRSRWERRGLTADWDCLRNHLDRLPSHQVEKSDHVHGVRIFMNKFKKATL
jgi:hypothetical protein